MSGPYSSTRCVTLLIMLSILLGHLTPGAVQTNQSAPEKQSKVLEKSYENKTADNIPEPDEAVLNMEQLPTGVSGSRLRRDRPIAWVDGLNPRDYHMADNLEHRKTLVLFGMQGAVGPLEDLGFEVVFGKDVSDFDVMYTRYDPSESEESNRIHTKAMVNHFPGIFHLTLKADLVQAHRYLGFIAEAYNLPDDKVTFSMIAESDPDQLWIHKNDFHRGVNLVRAGDINPGGSGAFVQQFLPDLHLIDGRRYDIGIFVTLTSLDPLRAYVYNDWVVRFCADEFLPFNSTNRRSFVIEEGFRTMARMPSLRHIYKGTDHHKRNALLAYLSHEGHNTDQLLDNLNDAIRKILLHKVPKMMPILEAKRETISNNAYEMMRFDFMLGANMDVHLIEVNMSPDCTFTRFAPPDYKNFYYELFYRLFNLVGIASTYGWPVVQWTQEELDMEVWDRNIRVYANSCMDEVCATNCTLDECMLCSQCLKDDDAYTLKRAYLEHMNRKTWRRVFPEPFKSQADAGNWTVPEDYTEKNKMLSLWFRGKCLEDLTWCA